ncbi:5658_t:CDS:2, partial [Funneliformis geosporum]
ERIFNKYQPIVTEDSQKEITIQKRPKYVLGILYNNKGIYLSKRIDPKKEMYNLWQTVCRKIEMGESSMTAIIREIVEETGIQLDKEHLEYILNDPTYNCDNTSMGVSTTALKNEIDINTRIQIIAKLIELTHFGEGPGVEWF